MSQSFTMESFELLGQPKLQVGEKKQRNTYFVGELRRQSPIDWRVYRAQFPKLERTQNTKLFSSFYNKDRFAICWWSQNLQLLYVHYQVINFWTAAASSSAKENLATWEKQNTMGPKWNLLAYPPLWCFFFVLKLFHWVMWWYAG